MGRMIELADRNYNFLMDYLEDDYSNMEDGYLKRRMFRLLKDLKARSGYQTKEYNNGE